MGAIVKKYVVSKGDEVFIERALASAKLAEVKRNMIIKYGAGIIVKEIR